MAPDDPTPATPAASTAHTRGTGDRDVVPGFPVKRFVLMLTYANMIFLGGAFAAMMVWAVYAMMVYSLAGAAYLGSGTGGSWGFLQLYGNALEDLWEFATDDFSHSAHFLFLAAIPGTIGGIAWYLILRWRESVTLKKRLLAARAKAKADLSQLPVSPA